MSLPIRVGGGLQRGAASPCDAGGGLQRGAAPPFDAITRQELLLRGVFGALAAGGAAAVGPFVRGALAQSGRADIEVVRFAYLLERLEQDFYERALREVPRLSGGPLRIARELARNEAEHAETLALLVGQLNSTVGQVPKFDFGDAFRDTDRFLEVAQTLEDTGVSAYNGAALLIEERNVLTAAGQIVQVEGRHAAWVRFERGEDITDGAFDRGKTMKQVEKRVAPFIVEEGG